MNDLDFIRYSRQILLEDISIIGQKKLLSSKVLIIGLGGLGAPVAIYLAAAGIGTMVLADEDKVHLSNLQRQILFTTKDISMPKVQVTQNRLQDLNPNIKIITLKEKMIGNFLQDQIESANLVLDCTDNIETKQAINAICVKSNIPLITASASGFTGMIMVIMPPWSYGCYRCFYPDDYEPNGGCYSTGILGPVVGVMGSLQALEAIMLLSDIKTERNKLRLFDARSGNWHNLILQRSNSCNVCGER